MLAQDCDFRFAAEDTVFGLPEGKWNLVPNFTGLFRKWLSPCIALELLLTGSSINAQRAYEIGFINKITTERNTVVVYNDTDSTYMTFQPVLDSCNYEGNPRDFILKLKEIKLDKYFNDKFNEYAVKYKGFAAE